MAPWPVPFRVLRLCFVQFVRRRFLFLLFVESQILTVWWLCEHNHQKHCIPTSQGRMSAYARVCAYPHSRAPHTYSKMTTSMWFLKHDINLFLSSRSCAHEVYTYTHTYAFIHSHTHIHTMTRWSFTHSKSTTICTWFPSSRNNAQKPTSRSWQCLSTHTLSNLPEGKYQYISSYSVLVFYPFSFWEIFLFYWLIEKSEIRFHRRAKQNRRICPRCETDLWDITMLLLQVHIIIYTHMAWANIC